VTPDLLRRATPAIVMPVLVVSLAILFKASDGVGDGFSAGVVAALALLFQVVVLERDEAQRMIAVRAAPLVAVAGLLIVLLTALAPVVWGAPLLSHQPEPGASAPHLGVLKLHTAVLFDSGIFLIVVGFALSAARLYTPSSATEQDITRTERAPPAPRREEERA
jgi:multisubunit Na+/H+ antiporter MnhB subunit